LTELLAALDDNQLDVRRGGADALDLVRIEGGRGQDADRAVAGPSAGLSILGAGRRRIAAPEARK
jgi:hypothetical protein